MMLMRFPCRGRGCWWWGRTLPPGPSANVYRPPPTRAIMSQSFRVIVAFDRVTKGNSGHGAILFFKKISKGDIVVWAWSSKYQSQSMTVFFFTENFQNCSISCHFGKKAVSFKKSNKCCLTHPGPWTWWSPDWRAVPASSWCRGNPREKSGAPEVKKNL